MEEHLKEGGSYGTSRKTERHGKKSASSAREEWQLLGQAFETMVRQVEVLKRQINQLRSTLQKKDGGTVDRGKEIVHYSSDVAEDLASNLNQISKELIVKVNPARNYGRGK